MTNIQGTQKKWAALRGVLQGNGVEAPATMANICQLQSKYIFGENIIEHNHGRVLKLIPLTSKYSFSQIC